MPTRRTLLSLSVLLHLLTSSLLTPVAAQQGHPHSPPPSASVPRVPAGSEPPRIDGDLTDEAWAHAVVLSEFAQVEPVEGGTPSERTEVRLLVDRGAIYLALHCFDDEPEEVRGTQRLRDARLNPDDRVEFEFDTFHDRRNGYWFQIGAGGSKGDALLAKNGASFNKDWDGIWEGKARITDQGWQAEVAIPFQTMNFGPDTDTWGFNIRRWIRRRNEEVRWAAPLQRIGFFSIANAGVLTGMTDLDQGLGLDVVPFAVLDSFEDRKARRRFVTGDLGLDAYYRLTPNFKLSLSVNTDFAETEVDDRQVNLTRFPLFFPEKRDFFLEDSGNFFFGYSSGRGGGSRSEVIPFFSRRIGIDGSGDEVPLLGAVKITGQTERFTLGLLDVGTDRLHELDERNLFVGRVGMNIFEQSDVGVIWTHGNPEGRTRNDTYGVDFNYRSDHFLGDRNLQFGTWVLRSDTEDVSGDELAASARIAYPNDEVDLSASWTTIDEDFDPALGFVPRRGIKRYRTSWNWRPRLNSGGIRQLRFSLGPSLTTDTGNDLETASVFFQPFGVEMESGDEFGLFLTRTSEILDSDFEIQDGVSIPEDRYDFTRYSIDVETSTHRVVSGELRHNFGTFFGGRRTDWSVELTARPGPWGTFDVEYERNDIDLPGGDFIVRVTRFRSNLMFTPELALSSFVQYDNVSDSVGLNSRLWWILEPGSELFLVLNQGWDYRIDRHFAPTSTQLTGKIGYTARF